MMTKKIAVEPLCDVCGAVRPDKGKPDHYELQHSDKAILLEILRAIKRINKKVSKIT